MSHELFYTSAPSGIKPGSKGFCTVACTHGMSAQLMDRLETLSGYRYLYEPGSPQASQNPISWAHWRISLQGKSRSVLSRVCDAGSDYSGRSNKFAHHVALEPNEQPACGPAFLLTREFMEKSWNGPPKTIPIGRPVPASKRSGGICDGWLKATGDAGWAGVLADSFMTDPSKPVYIVYNPGVDILGLFEEAMALLPDAARWQVTFNTYFTDLPAGLTCAWRGIVAGTPAVKEASRQGGRALLVDLAKAGACSVQSPMVEFARTGIRPIARERSQPASEALLGFKDEGPFQQSESIATAQPVIDFANPSGRSQPNVVIVEREVLTPNERRRSGVPIWLFVVSLACAALLFSGVGIWVGTILSLKPVGNVVAATKSDSTRTVVGVPASSSDMPNISTDDNLILKNAHVANQTASSSQPFSSQPSSIVSTSSPQNATIPVIRETTPTIKTAAGISIVFPRDLQKSANKIPVPMSLIETVDKVEIEFPNNRTEFSVDDMGGIKGFRLSVNPFSDTTSKVAIALDSRSPDLAILEYSGGNLNFNWKGDGDDVNMRRRIAYVLQSSKISLNGKLAGKTISIPVNFSLEAKSIAFSLSPTLREGNSQIDIPVAGLRIVSSDGTNLTWDNGTKEANNLTAVSAAFEFGRFEPTYAATIPKTNTTKEMILKGQDFQVIFILRYGGENDSLSASANLSEMQRWADDLAKISPELDKAVDDFKRSEDNADIDIKKLIESGDPKLADNERRLMDFVRVVEETPLTDSILPAAAWNPKYLKNNVDWITLNGPTNAQIAQLVAKRGAENELIRNLAKAEEMRIKAKQWIGDLTIKTLKPQTLDFSLKLGDVIAVQPMRVNLVFK